MITPSKLDLSIWRGGTYELELITQKKIFTYDPAINTSVADLKRTYLENQAEYGFVYEYVDFETTYTDAELKILKPWVRPGHPVTTPLLVLDTTSGITLTSSSIQIVIPVEDTKGLTFDSGIYKLTLIRADGESDYFMYGDVLVSGDRE